MGIYKPKKSRYFHYDFVYRGRRFCGSTGQEATRAAERVERKLRLDAAEGRLGDASQVTLEQAASKYWLEHGQFRGDAVDTERRLEMLLRLIPKATPIADITTTVVSAAVQRRRAIFFTKSPKPDAQRYPPTNGTVNRDVIQTLRPILRRAKIHWGAKGLPEIAWKELRLQEPRESVRIYSDEERAAWTRENCPTGALALRLLMTYGLRYKELFFPLDCFQDDGRSARLAWRKGRKGDVPHTVPLLEIDRREIAARVARARAAHLDTIMYVEKPNERTGDVALVPLTYYGLQARLRSSSKRAKIEQGRVIHGARHHAGTTIQRAYGNSKVTQRLLGHLDARSTDRYVHATDNDVRTALEMVEKSRNSPEPPARDRKKTQLL